LGGPIDSSRFHPVHVANNFNFNLGAQQGKLDADLRTSALLGTSSFQSANDYYPFALEYGDELALVAAEMVEGLSISVAFHHFFGMGVSDSRSLP
jgi:hypothetical protein